MAESKTRSVLVIAAHPDDEVLGCGGTVARHAAAGDTVTALIVAEGATSRDAENQTSDVEALQSAARRAAAVLGADEPRFLGLPDNRLDTVPMLDIVRAIEETVAALCPDVVYTHHPADLNVDHRIVAGAAMTACRPLPESSVSSIYAFETVSSTEWAPPSPEDAFLPNRFVDIGDVLDGKTAALGCYESEMRAFPHPRSIEAVTALAQWRGAAVGIEAAEAFMTLREIVR